MRKYGIWVLVAAVSLLVGCSTTVPSRVTVFHEWDTALQKVGFAFEPAPESAKSLEHKTYEGLVRDQLVQLGLREMSAREARLLVKLNYDVSARDVQTGHNAYPAHWLYPRWAYWSSGSYIGLGWEGERQPAVRLYEHKLSVTLTDRTVKPPKNVFEASAVNESQAQEMNVVMPYLVRSLFADFPGASGQTRVVTLPYES